MRGGSLTRFRPDDTQLGEGIIGDIVKATLLGGLTGLKSSQRLGDVQKNTVQGLKQGLKRGVKRKTNWCINCVLMRVMERRERDSLSLSRRSITLINTQLIHQFVFRHADAVNPVLIRAGITLFG